MLLHDRGTSATLQAVTIAANGGLCGVACIGGATAKLSAGCTVNDNRGHGLYVLLDLVSMRMRTTT